MPKRMLLACLAACGLALLLAVRGCNSTTALEWYFDLNDRQLFRADATMLPPIPAPSGDVRGEPVGTAAGVRAQVLLVDGRETQVAFLETYGPVARELLRAHAAGRDLPQDWLERINRDTYVALVPESADAPPQWLSAADPKAEVLVTAVERRLVEAGHRVEVLLP